jgi:16S rRNA (uracil1498-N3)-methyltransferase
MEAPFFYSETKGNSQTLVILDENASKHIVQSLRMKTGEELLLTDGKGNVFSCVIKIDHKKRCEVEIQQTIFKPQTGRRKSIAISLLKNKNRFEWFLEKATELGVTEIIPLICERTEKTHYRIDRMKNILISAMLQSQQSWLPELTETQLFSELVFKSRHAQKFIAHCLKNGRLDLTEAINSATDSQIILIGPEGDFSPAEINLARDYHFLPVSLGETRLRTETAGIVAATLLTR